MRGKKSWKFTAGILIATLFCGAAWLLWPAPGPVHQGKPLSVWFGDGLFEDRNPNPSDFLPTTNHYPRLIHMIEAKSSPRLEKLKLWANNKHLLKRRFQTVGSINERGLALLERFGDDLEFAVPDLLQRYDHAARGSFERYAISVSLGRMRSAGPAAARCLSDTLADDRSAMSRMEAADFLGNPQLPVDVAVPALCKGLGDSSSLVRGAAAGSLSRFGTNAVSALPALRKLAGFAHVSSAGPDTPSGSAPSWYGNMYGQMTDVECAQHAIRAITSANRRERNFPH